MNSFVAMVIRIKRSCKIIADNIYSATYYMTSWVGCRTLQYENRVMMKDLNSYQNDWSGIIY
jgi:hypothetical protein